MSKHNGNFGICGCLLFAASLWIWLIPFIQYTNGKAVSNVWIGAGFASLGVALYIIFFESARHWITKVGVTSLLVGYLILSFIFLPNLVKDVLPPQITERELSVDLSLTPMRYQRGQKGTLQVSIYNKMDFEITIPQLTLEVPFDFFEGYIIEYPTIPQHDSVRNQFMSIQKPTIIFKDISIPPNLTTTLIIPLVANNPGDYSGTFMIRATNYPFIFSGSDKLIACKRSFNLNVIITP